MVGAITVFTVIKVWLSGYFSQTLACAGYGDVPVSSLENSLFGMILFLGMDALDFVGYWVIFGVKLLYSFIYDAVYGTRKVVETLKTASATPVVAIKAVEPPPVQESTPSVPETTAPPKKSAGELLVEIYNMGVDNKKSIDSLTVDVNKLKKAQNG